MTSKARGADGMGSFHKLIHMRGAAWRVLAVGVFGVMLLGCAHHAPAVIRQRMVVISGKGTAQDNPKDAARKVLIEAAAITLDHGYRYFEIVGAEGMSANSSALPTIRPGTDVTIKVFGAGEVDPRPPSVWDAQAIGAGELP
ncbi:MAG TPA: hypothetical protein VNX86_02885 [Rhizomicrobium sp.]|jgi:hypothetical protein|nr:hypothetical protein [Rhizomicrobium sp.]